MQVEYWELDEDPGDLLFGYGAWPVAESLSKLLINSTLSEHDSQVVPSVHGKHVLEIGVWVASIRTNVERFQVLLYIYIYNIYILQIWFVKWATGNCSSITSHNLQDL